jgi:hypothetical protein
VKIEENEDKIKEYLRRINDAQEGLIDDIDVESLDDWLHFYWACEEYYDSAAGLDYDAQIMQRYHIADIVSMTMKLVFEMRFSDDWWRRGS